MNKISILILCYLLCNAAGVYAFQPDSIKAPATKFSVGIGYSSMNFFRDKFTFLNVTDDLLNGKYSRDETKNHKTYSYGVDIIWHSKKGVFNRPLFVTGGITRYIQQNDISTDYTHLTIHGYIEPVLYYNEAVGFAVGAGYSIYSTPKLSVFAVSSVSANYRVKEHVVSKTFSALVPQYVTEEIEDPNPLLLSFIHGGLSLEYVFSKRFFITASPVITYITTQDKRWDILINYPWGQWSPRPSLPRLLFETKITLHYCFFTSSR